MDEDFLQCNSIYIETDDEESVFAAEEYRTNADISKLVPEEDNLSVTSEIGGRNRAFSLAIK